MERKHSTTQLASTFPPLTLRSKPGCPPPLSTSLQPVPACSPTGEDDSCLPPPPLLPVLSSSSHLSDSFRTSELSSPSPLPTLSPCPLPTLSPCSGHSFTPHSALPLGLWGSEERFIPPVHEFHYVAEPQQVTKPHKTTVLTVVWDLDETLVDARDYRRGAISPSRVHVRPCFAEVLAACSKPGIEIVIWTASVRSHATAIMEELRPYFLGYNCWPKSVVHRGLWTSRAASYCKDVSLLNGCARGRVLIFDNSPEVLDCPDTRPCAILVPDFRVDFTTSLIPDNTLHHAALCVKSVYRELIRQPQVSVSVPQVLTKILSLPPDVIAAIGDPELYTRVRLQKETELAELRQQAEEEAIRRRRGAIRREGRRGGVQHGVEDTTPSRPPRSCSPV